jgi:hypothetical protein
LRAVLDWSSTRPASSAREARRRAVEGADEQPLARQSNALQVGGCPVSGVRQPRYVPAATSAAVPVRPVVAGRRRLQRQQRPTSAIATLTVILQSLRGAVGFDRRSPTEPPPSRARSRGGARSACSRGGGAQATAALSISAAISFRRDCCLPLRNSLFRLRRPPRRLRRQSELYSPRPGNQHGPLTLWFGPLPHDR